MKRFVWMFLPVMFLCFACNERDTSTVRPAVTKTPDIVTEEDGITAAFFDSKNPHTIQSLEDALTDPAVTAEIESFEKAGYTLTPEYSFYVEGERDGGGEVKITTLVMENTTDPSHDAVYLFCLHGIDRKVVVPVTLTFSKEAPGNDFEQIGDDVWIGLSGPPSTACTADIDPAAARISWRQWLRCISERMVAGGISCAYLCLYAPGGYLQCIAVCAAGHAVYAFIQCSIAQL